MVQAQRFEGPLDGAIVPSGDWEHKVCLARRYDNVLLFETIYVTREKDSFRLRSGKSCEESVDNRPGITLAEVCDKCAPIAH